MNQYIATWIYLETKEERSKYPNNKGDASSKEFQAVYWKCVVLFYITSLRFNQTAKHILFTNSEEALPVIDGFDVGKFMADHEITVEVVPNKYPLPPSYFDRFRNQFFEFSIIERMAGQIKENDGFLLLDSDCIFRAPVDELFSKLQNEESALTYVVDHVRKYQVHGVTGDAMREICEDLGLSLKENPYYCGGEVLLTNGKFLKQVAEHFPSLYQNMLERNEKGLPKFNEEAHTLTYYYYKHKSNIDGLAGYVKRIWTNRNYFRNVSAEDVNLLIWHLPNEKNTGFNRLFEYNQKKPLLKIDEKTYQSLIFDYLLRKENYPVDWYRKMKNFGYKVALSLGLKTK